MLHGGSFDMSDRQGYVVLEVICWAEVSKWRSILQRICWAGRNMFPVVVDRICWRRVEVFSRQAFTAW
jgi:hypothetical protein